MALDGLVGMRFSCLCRMGLPPEPAKPAAAVGVAAPLSNEAQLAKAIETLSQYKVCLLCAYMHLVLFWVGLVSVMRVFAWPDIP